MDTSNTNEFGDNVHEIGTRVGVYPHYYGLDGARHAPSADAVAQILRAMGDTPPDSTAVQVIRGQNQPTSISLPIPASWSKAAPFAGELRDEKGAKVNLAVPPAVDESGHLVVVADAPLKFGYYDLVLTTTAAPTKVLTMLIVVAPSTCRPMAEPLGNGRGTGVGVDLYSLRSRTNWGVGDFADVQRLIDWAKTLGLSYLGLPPLHAVSNHGFDFCPYSPVSRIFLNNIYLCISEVPEWSAGRDEIETSSHQRELQSRRAATVIDYENVVRAKTAAARVLWRRFLGARGTNASARRDAFFDFKAAGGPELLQFATFMALAEHFAPNGFEGPARWPTAYHRANDPAVVEFAHEHGDDVGFYCWLQFETDRQLGRLAAAARAKLSLGLFLDLAVGAAPSGFDLWAHPDLFLPKIAVGAPPDYFNPQGQNWGFPPLNPLALRTPAGCRYLAKLVGAACRHAGILRIDHAAGLHRLFVIPEGVAGSDGTYIEMPADVIYGILAVESWRHHTVVIGEDLGNVPDEARARLQKECILGYRVLLFEGRGDPNGPTNYPPPAVWPKPILATATTHDTPPLRAWLEAADVQTRLRLGLLDESQVSAALAERYREVSGLVARLHEEGLLTEPGLPGFGTFREAVHRYLGRSSADLIEVRLANVGPGEIEPVNVPGIAPPHFPCWQTRMTTTIEDLQADADVSREFKALVAERI